jgi:hypothetical protein
MARTFRLKQSVCFETNSPIRFTSQYSKRKMKEKTREEDALMENIYTKKKIV